MSELLPCPFCGGKAEIHPSNDWDAKFTGATFFAWCDKCETRGDYYNTEAEAIAAWNTRAERICHIEYPYYGDAPVINGQPRCSECKTEFVVGMFPNYCPNCGAKVVS